MTTRHFIPDTANLAELFGLNSQPLVVPPYQRRFAWIHGQEVADMWDDLVEACNSDVDEYFLGTIVLCHGQSGQGSLEVIDGQQRLATLTMILAAVRNRLLKLSDGNDPASQAAYKIGEFIERRGLVGDIRGFAFSIGQLDKDSFERYVQLRPTDSRHLDVSIPLSAVGRGRRRTNKIQGAFRSLIQKVENYHNSISYVIAPEEEVNSLANFAEYVLGRVIFIKITVQDDVDAFNLFETMNSRGLDLSTADLLKNHLFGLASPSREQSSNLGKITGLWTEFVRILENQQMTRFLRYYWMSHNGTVTEKNLYKSIKNWIENQKVAPDDFLEHLNENAQQFVELVNPSDGSSQALDLKDLVDMRMTQGLPFLMSAKDKLNQKEFEIAVKIVEALSVRNTIVGQRNPNLLERSFGSWARALRQDESIESIVERARDYLVTDEEFVNGFSQLSELSTAQARYLLRKIEWSENNETQMVSSGIEVEHILPQSPNDAWKEYMGGSDEEIAEARYRLGNLTLMNERLNKSAAARLFDEKKKQYAQSNIGITKSLADHDNWSYQVIESRQMDFAQQAKSIWSL